MVETERAAVSSRRLKPRATSVHDRKKGPPGEERPWKLFRRSLLAGLRGLLTSGVVQNALAQTQALWGDLDEFVSGDVFDRALE